MLQIANLHQRCNCMQWVRLKYLSTIINSAKNYSRVAYMQFTAPFQWIMSLQTTNHNHKPLVANEG